MHITRWPRALEHRHDIASRASTAELSRRSTYEPTLAPPPPVTTTRAFRDLNAPPPASGATHLWPSPNIFGPKAPSKLTADLVEYQVYVADHPDPFPDKETLQELTKTWNNILAGEGLCSEPPDLLKGPCRIEVRKTAKKFVRPWAEVTEPTNDEVFGEYSETPSIISKGLRETEEGRPPSRSKKREDFRVALTPAELQSHPKYRDMVIEWNCTFEGMKNVEAAQLEGITPGAARTRRSRFRDLEDLKQQFTEEQLAVMRDNWTCVVVLHAQEYVKVLDVPYEERDYDALTKAKDKLMKATIKDRKKQLAKEKLSRWDRVVRWMQEQARIMLAYDEAYLFDPVMVRQLLPALENDAQGTSVTDSLQLREGTWTL